METLEESLSRQFYAWEKRGRGWEVFDYPVEIEPRPRPFYFAPPPERPALDDSQVQTFFSRMFGGGSINNSSALTTYKNDLAEYQASFAVEDDPDYCEYSNEPFREIRILLPEDSRPSKSTIDQFISSLDYTVHPISFEVIGTQDQVIVQFCATAPDIAQLRQQFAAHFPQGSYIEGEDHLINRWINSDEESSVVDFGLSEEFFLPLAPVNNIETDPLIAVVGAMSDLDEDEIGVFQVLFKKVGYNWQSVVLDAMTRLETTDFLSYIPDAKSLSREKLRSPFYATVVRVGAKAYSESGALRIVRNIAASLNQIARPGSNELMPLSNDGYDDDHHVGALLDRMSMRSGMLLNRDELISLVHPPASTVREEKLVRISTRTRKAPGVVQGNSLRLGVNHHQHEEVAVSLSNDQRTRHMHVIGSSGSGKSTLLLSMIAQDMKAGHGVCVLDPHGDLIDDVISRVPESRLDDVIVFDPSDAEFPVAFNILEAKSELEKTLLSSDLIATFRRMSTSWGDVMDSVLANAILAFVENTRGGTLFDLKRFLVEQEFRGEILPTVTDPAVQYFWRHEFPLVSGKPQSSILIRLDAFLRQKMIRNIVCQKDMRFSFRDVMDRKKILLIKLSQGLIGEENAYLLGTLLVSKIYQTALTRQDSDSRPHFWMYIDEFHHFITPSMERILAGTRKYNLGLILAHQEFRQMQSRSQDVASSVLSNCYSRVCFRMGDADASKFADGFSFFDSKALQNLGVGEAIARVERAEYDFNLQTEMLARPSDDIARERRQRVEDSSRSKYARPRAEVEAEIVIPDPPPPREKEPRASRQKTQESGSSGSGNQTDPKEPRAETPKPPPTPHAEPPRPPKSEPEDVPEVSVVAKPPADRDSRQHKYLQALVKRIGESFGFRVTLEKPVRGREGRVDVALESEELRIACEIGVTNEPAYEVKNLRKCLDAGFDRVVMISSDERHLAKIHKLAAESILEAELSKIEFLAPDAFYAWLENIAGENQKTETVKGFKVKMKVKTSDERKQSTKSKAISDIFMGAIRRLRDKPNEDEKK